jgi:hypothetical protein
MSFSMNSKGVQITRDVASRQRQFAFIRQHPPHRNIKPDM